MTPDPHWTTFASFWISLIAVVAAIAATVINRALLRTQVDPSVILYATGDPDRPTIINLVVENMGRGLARDIQFTLAEPIPSRAFGVADAPMPAEMDSGPLISGIPALGPALSV